MQLSRTRLLQFYDERLTDPSRGGNISAVTGMLGEDLVLGIFRHYLLRTENCDVQLLPSPCNSAKRKGPRLDAWVLKRSDGNQSLYQVEVKNWSAYSIGGRSLPLSCSESVLRRTAETEWSRQFPAEGIRSPAVGKVLHPMKEPPGFSGTTITPLLCFWFAITSNFPSPYSLLRLQNNASLHVFSCSLYLRALQDEILDLPMPRFEKRMAMIRDLLVSPED